VNPRHKSFWIESRLSEDDVLDMRALKKNGMTIAELSMKYEISVRSVLKVIHGQVRPDLPGATPAAVRRNGCTDAEIAERRREYSKEWRSKNLPSSDLRRRATEQSRMYRRRDGTGGWDVPDDSLCAICGAKDRDVQMKTSLGAITTKRLLVMDHDHSTGVVREPLCMSCNTILGIVEKDPEKISRMFDYIKKWTLPRVD
jgi:hypothetical protein